MGLFGGKDKVQDKAIQNINNHLKALWNWVKAFENYHKEMNKLLPKIFKRLEKLEQKKDKNIETLFNHVSSLEKTIAAMKEKDKQFAAMFQNLATVSTEAVKKGEEG